MSRAILRLALACLCWTHGPHAAAKPTAVEGPQAPAPADQMPSWRTLRVTVAPVTAEELSVREALLPPGTVPRAGVASPTRSPWVNANGWRFLRKPAGRFVYDVPAGKGALAAAEAAAYGADAILKIVPEDVPAVTQMITFLRQVPDADLPGLADFGVVDDGSPELGEVLNLLVRRNLLFERVSSPSSRYGLNVKLGTPEYPREKAADPSAFALAVRRHLTDDKRSLRIFGSEVIIARATADGGRARLHFVNYGGRPIDGLRVRLRGSYQTVRAYVAGAAADAAVADHIVADGATEFSMPRITVYAVADLR
jgi:hypothetical protein